MRKQRHHKRWQRQHTVSLNGDPCPRCHQPTEVHQHNRIKQKHLNQPYYYSRWFVCVNPKCRTEKIMLERYRVYRDIEAQQTYDPRERDVMLQYLDGKL